MTFNLQSLLSKHRRIRWRKFNWGVAAAVFAFFLLGFSLLLSTSPNKTTHFTLLSDMVPLTLIRNAKATGAFCLDGSLPGYHFQKGFGLGSNNWLLHIEGGGWCNTIASCSYRKTTALGSSKYMDHRVKFAGILSSDPSQNPGWASVCVCPAGHSQLLCCLSGQTIAESVGEWYFNDKRVQRIDCPYPCNPTCYHMSFS